MARSNAFRNALTFSDLWWSAALKVCETAVASPQVIAHRTARMVRAGPLPGPADQKEFTRMVQEKAHASTEGARDMALEMFRINQQIAASALQTWMRACAGSLRPGILPTVPALATSAVSPLQAAIMGTRVMAKGLAPIHRRATANATRLTRARKR